MSTTKAFYWTIIFGLFGLFSCQQSAEETQTEIRDERKLFV